MKSQKIIQESIKTEIQPKESHRKVYTSRKFRSNKSSSGSDEITVKETTIEKSYQKSYKKEESDIPKNINITSTKKEIITTNLKKETNSGSSSQNNIPALNKEDTSESKFSKYQKFKTTKTGQEITKERKYSKREVELIIKIQRWWKRILARLNGYKIREKLRIEKGNGYIIKNREVVREKYYSNNKSHKKDYSTGKNIINKIDTNKNYKISNNTNRNIINSTNSNTSSYSNINSYSNYSNKNLQKIKNSKSYTNINSINTRVTKGLNINTNLSTSSSQNYIQSKSKNVQGYSKYAGSTSTSPSVKSKYIIETKKVEIFKRPENYLSNKTMNQNTYTTMSEINRYEVKDIMKNIWNEESYCSTVESLCCLSDENKSMNISHNSQIFEEYEEELRKLKILLMEKEDELNHLRANLKETEIVTKYTSTYNQYNKNNKNKFAQGLQKSNWNEINLPSPVSEIYIESWRTGFNAGMAYNLEKYSQKIKREESAQETISDSDAVLEIQEMNALSIISNKIKPQNICQHLQSLMILSKKNEEEDFIFQKIEEINITSIINKPRNQIQELDGFEIISRKRKTTNIMIQELDGFEILRIEKNPHIPQCVDELNIEREYDMLLVKPTWNSLQIQGSGLNLLAIPKDMAVENQEVDEFEIIGKSKPKIKPVFSIQSRDKITLLKTVIPQKISVLVPVPKNIIKQGERFGFRGIKKEPEIKYIERFIKEKIEVIPNEIEIIDKIELKGEEMPDQVHIEQKEFVPIKRKGLVDHINKKIITKKQEK